MVMTVIFKWLLSLLGIILMVLGVIISPLPGPMGLPVFIIGLIMTLRYSSVARRLFIRLKERHPKWVGPIRRMLRKRAKVVAIVWHQMLKTELFFSQMVTKGRLKLLKPSRRQVKKWFFARPKRFA
jgi:Putative transmembrane protein (PGPGW)